MRNYEEAAGMVETVAKIVGFMKNQRMEEAVLNDIQAAVREVNLVLYRTETLKHQKRHNLNAPLGYGAYVEELEQTVEIWRTSLSRYSGKQVDADFWNTYEYFSYVPKETIYERVKKRFQKLPESLRLEFLALPNRYSFLSGKIDFTEDDYSLIRQHVDMMSEKVEDYKWLYEHLADYRSKYILNGIIAYWFTFDVAALHQFVESVFPDYYDLDIVAGGPEDVMVDLGAFIGDSVLSYVNTYGTYGKIYAYEITPGTFRALRQNVSGLQNVVLCQKGVGAKNGRMYIEDSNGGAGNRLVENGAMEIEVVSLDEDIQERIDVIKMDIEGAEKDALEGAKRHIQEEKPSLLISAYHLPGDLFDIPKLISQMRGDYRFYLRFNGKGCLWPCDYVLYAV